MSKTVEFKFDLYDKVNTPLVNDAIITMQGVDDGGNTYYIKNNVDGVSDCWWPEAQLTKV